MSVASPSNADVTAFENVAFDVNGSVVLVSCCDDSGWRVVKKKMPAICDSAFGSEL